MVSSSMEQAIARYENNSLRQAKAVTIQSLDDIMRVLTGISPDVEPYNQSTNIETTINTIDNGRQEAFKVKATANSTSKRQIILDAFEALSKQLKVSELKEEIPVTEVNGISMKPAKLMSGIVKRSYIDPLLEQWLGAFREGLDICWKIGRNKYVYDIFNHKLNMIEDCYE